MGLEDVGGLGVVSYGGGQELLDDKPEAPDVFLLDVMMPGMDGVDLLEALRRLPAYEGVPAIFITAKAQPAEVEDLISAGAIGVIRKPFDPMTLADQVHKLVQGQ